MERVERTAAPVGLKTETGQRVPVGGTSRSRLPVAVEWPTVLVALAIYVPWFATTWAVGQFGLPLWIWAPVLAWTIAWQASLQHEVIHGHPTPSRWVNRVIAGPPLMLWLPFDRYRDTHLDHHIDERLTDPFDDPESWYVTADQWRRKSRVTRWVRLFMNSLAGRLFLAPVWLAWNSLKQDIWDVAAGRRRSEVGVHLLQVAGIVGWLWVCGVPVWLYVLAAAWPATSLLALRTFAEHQPAPDPACRTVVVEGGGPLDLLYLSNNLHAVHHERPGLPWYALRKVYSGTRDSVLERNGGYRFDSYRQVGARYLFTVRDHPIHPNDR